MAECCWQGTLKSEYYTKRKNRHGETDITVAMPKNDV